MPVNKIEFAKDLSFPIDAATQTFAFIARKRAGKSYAAGKMLEGFYQQGVPFVVVDPVGIHWGLRLAADGKAPGLDIPVLGGEELLALWGSKLPGKAAQMLGTLIEVWPSFLTREALGAAVTISPTSSTFRNYLSLLRSNGLVATQGIEVRACESLFPHWAGPTSREER